MTPPFSLQQVDWMIISFSVATAALNLWLSVVLFVAMIALGIIARKSPSDSQRFKVIA